MRALGGGLGRISAPWLWPARKCAARRLAVPASSAPAAPDGYDTPSGAFTLETVVKASRFIATVASVSSPDDALAFVAKHRDPEARHNCWAYRCGDQFRFNDDGEPGGTAGRPVLAALEASGLDRAVVLVVRFFGGVKLGAGGLTRGASRVQRAATCVAC
jgi:putative IMPACT (imprinted ancient) family translation regulator